METPWATAPRAYSCCFGLRSPRAWGDAHLNILPVPLWGICPSKLFPLHWVRMSNISTNQEADELVIAGDVSRRNSAFSGKGHVDVAVVSPAGKAICKASANYTPAILPKTAGARNHRSSHFEVDLRCTPPPKSVIRIAYHNKSGPDDPHPGCEDNAAL